MGAFMVRYPANIDLSKLSGANGFTLTGEPTMAKPEFRSPRHATATCAAAALQADPVSRMNAQFGTAPSRGA